MIFNELNTGFRWYNALDKQARFKEQCESMCDFALIAPCDDLLPFQFKSSSFGTPTTWLLKYLDGIITVPVFTPSIEPGTLLWGIAGSGTPGFLLRDNTNLNTIGVADWQGSYDLTLQKLADSVNNNIAYGSLFGGAPAFSNAAGYTAIYNSSLDEFSVSAPVGFGSTYNGINIFLANNGGAATYTGGIQNIIFSGGVNESISYTTGDTIDISQCREFLNVVDADSYTYVSYNGESLKGCLITQLDCGKWYSQITDENDVSIYSEVFEVVQFEDIPFQQMKLPLFNSLRFYDDINKQTRYKEYCETACNFYLLSGNDRILPFQIKAPDDTAMTPTWKLVGINGDCEMYLDPSLLEVIGTGDGDRITYNAGLLTNLPCGKFYVVVDDGNTVWYSELFEIIDLQDTFNNLQTDDGVNILTDSGIEIIVD